MLSPIVDPGAAVPVITEAAIRELAAFRGEDAPVTSCYLDVDGRRLVRRSDYEHQLDILLRSARDKVNGSDSVATDLRRIEEYVKAGFDRSTTRGLAFFSCSAHDLWEVIPLPVPVHNRVVVNSVPAVGQLESVVQDYERIGVLLADRQRARMFVFELGEITEQSTVLDELPRDYDERGHGDLGYDRERHHVDELAAQHLRHAAKETFELFQRTPFGCFTVGAPDAIFNELEACLHPYLRERLGPRVGVGVNASIDEIRSAVFEIEGEINRRREADLVERLRSAIDSSGRGMKGLDPVLRALHEHRVEHLVVSDGYVEAGWSCGSCGALAAIGRTCAQCGADMEHLDDVVEEAVEMALTQKVKVQLCVGNADLDVLGRIGALLRY